MAKRTQFPAHLVARLQSAGGEVDQRVAVDQGHAPPSSDRVAHLGRDVGVDLDPAYTRVVDPTWLTDRCLAESRAADLLVRWRGR